MLNRHYIKSGMVLHHVEMFYIKLNRIDIMLNRHYFKQRKVWYQVERT